MSFRRYVGKYVQVTARGVDGSPVEYLAKLFEYEQAGIWLHHGRKVTLAAGKAQQFEGYLFIPYTHVVNVFSCDELDQTIEDAKAAGGDA